MIQATGLTKASWHGRPAVFDVSFDARPGQVTVLLDGGGTSAATVLRLMVELERGTGATLFAGLPYRRIRNPEREVGVVMTGGRSPGHPDRRARSHLHMIAALVGVPARRADDLLEQTRLAAVADQRLRSFSPDRHRRLALAAALLADPGILVADALLEGVPPKSAEWFRGFLRAFAVSGGTVLATTRDPEQAGALADRVVTLDHGRILGDETVVDFLRARRREEVAVRGPQVGRLADMLRERGAGVRRESGTAIAVTGIGRTEIGEIAYRHGILLHELADRVVPRDPLLGIASAAPACPVVPAPEKRGRNRGGPDGAAGPGHGAGTFPWAAGASTGAPALPVRAGGRGRRPPGSEGVGSALTRAGTDSGDGSPQAQADAVVVLTPGAAVTTTVTPFSRHGWERQTISGPLFRDEAVHSEALAAIGGRESSATALSARDRGCGRAGPDPRDRPDPRDQRAAGRRPDSLDRPAPHHRGE